MCRCCVTLAPSSRSGGAAAEVGVRPVRRAKCHWAGTAVRRVHLLHASHGRGDVREHVQLQVRFLSCSLQCHKWYSEETSSAGTDNAGMRMEKLECRAEGTFSVNNDDGAAFRVYSTDNEGIRFLQGKP